MMVIMLDLRNSYSRDGKFEVRDFESALEQAKEYVSRKSAEGAFAYAHIMWYLETRSHDRYLDSEITISSVPSGEYTSIGYPIPKPEGFRKSLYVSMNKGCNKIEHLYRELDIEEDQ